MVKPFHPLEQLPLTIKKPQSLNIKSGFDKITSFVMPTMASIDLTITSIIVVSATSKHAWDALHTIYANKSHTRIFSLRNTLTKVSKDNKSIVEYLREVRTITDELATAGALVTNEELVVKS